MLHLNKIHQEDHLYAAFSYFDKDGSGYITHDELQQACETFGLQNTDLDEIIREIDQDNVSYTSLATRTRVNSLPSKYFQFLVFVRMEGLIIMNSWR